MASGLPPQGPVSGSKFRVLVVDAEPLARWALLETLSTAGFDVVEMTPDPPYAAVGGVDVLVLDATLSRGGALRVLEHVRALNPTCKVVLLTSFDPVGLARLADSSPLWRAVQKPFELPAVVEAVDELVRRPVRSRGSVPR
jgi:DNA-binding NtrC family response regulator